MAALSDSESDEEADNKVCLMATHDSDSDKEVNDELTKTLNNLSKAKLLRLVHNLNDEIKLLTEQTDEKDELINLAAEENELWRNKVKEIQEKESAVPDKDTEHAENVRMLEGEILMLKLSVAKIKSEKLELETEIVKLKSDDEEKRKVWHAELLSSNVEKEKADFKRKFVQVDLVWDT